MKKILCFSFILAVLGINAQVYPIPFIESYSLGRGYEKFKNDTYFSYKMSCKENSTYSAYYYLYPDAGRNTNTLAEQMKAFSISSDYREFRERIKEKAFKVKFLGSEECSKERYDYEKNHH